MVEMMMMVKTKMMVMVTAMMVAQKRPRLIKCAPIKQL